MRKLWVVLGCGLAVLCPSRASASALQFQGMGLHDIVTIAATNGAESTSGSFYAGEIEWTWDAPPPSGFAAALTTYCIDVFHELTSVQAVEIRETSEISAPATNAGGKVAWLVNSFAPLVASGLEAAALQIAIWETLYDNDHNLATGNFRMITTDAPYTGTDHALSIASQANAYLNQLYGQPGGGYSQSSAIWLQVVSNGGQDQIATPEPGSLLLLGIGGLMMRLRRRRVPEAMPS